jgi:hypothetical protein
MMSSIEIKGTLEGAAAQRTLEKISQLLLQHENISVTVDVSGAIDNPVFVLAFSDSEMRVFELLRANAKAERVQP